MNFQCSCNPESYPFWCERHQCMKIEAWVKLCKYRPAYFEAWEKGEGPGQNHSPEFYENQKKSREKRAKLQEHRNNKTTKPGTELRKILIRWINRFSWFRYEISYSECSCTSIFHYMDILGIKKCTKNIKHLVKRLKEVAIKHKILFEFDDKIAEKIIKQAIRRAKRNMGEFPSSITMMKNFASSMTNWVKSGLKMVNKEIYQERLAICKQCDYFHIDQGRCEKCGCFMLGKCWLATEECPEKLWLSTIDNKIESDDGSQQENTTN